MVGEVTARATICPRVGHNFHLRCVVQRASWAEVVVEGDSCGKMGPGLVIFFGIAADRDYPPFDQKEDVVVQSAIEKLANKLLGLRIFCDEDGKMNLSVRDVGGSLYVVSQFTLFAECKKGFRPGFSAAARPQLAEPVYQQFVSALRDLGGGVAVYCGVFGGDMKVSLLNDGPVTVIIDADARGIR